MSHRTIAIDFDGVLAQYDGWKGSDHLGEPMPGALQWVNRKRAEGCIVFVFSTRPAWRLEAWAKQHGFTFDGYNHNPVFDPGDNEERSGKPPADVYVDDRAVLFSSGDSPTDPWDKVDWRINQVLANHCHPAVEQ